MGKVGLGNAVSRIALAALSRPPNYAEVIQWLGTTYQNELWYQEDKKGDQLRDVHLGGFLDMNGADNTVETDVGATTGNHFGACSIKSTFITDSDVTTFQTIHALGFSAYRLYIDGGVFKANSSTVITTVVGNTKYEAELFFNSSGQAISFNIDGVEVWSGVAGAGDDQSDSFYIGVRSSATILGAFFKGDVEYLKLDASNGLWYDFEGLNPTVSPIVYDKSGNDNHGTFMGTLANIYQESITVESYRNLNGYNIDVNGVYVPRLETAENIALPINQQKDVLGNVLLNYGRARYDVQVVDSSIANFNGVDNEIIIEEQVFSTFDIIVTGIIKRNYTIQRHIFADNDGSSRLHYSADSVIFTSDTTGGLVSSPIFETELGELHTWRFIYNETEIEIYVDGVLRDTITGVPIGGTFTVNTISGIRGAATSAEIGNPELHYIKIGNFETYFPEASGTISYNKAGDGNSGTILGTLTNFWDTSDAQRPSNLLDGFSPAISNDEITNSIVIDIPAGDLSNVTMNFKITPQNTAVFNIASNISDSFSRYIATSESGSAVVGANGLVGTAWEAYIDGVLFDSIAIGKTRDDYYTALNDKYVEFMIDGLDLSDWTNISLLDWTGRIYKGSYHSISIDWNSNGIYDMELFTVVEGTYKEGLGKSPSDCLYDSVSNTYFENSGTGDLGLVRIPAKEGSTTLDALGNTLLNPPAPQGHNGAESELLQPEAPELYAVSQNFTVDPWFSGTTPVNYGYDIMTADYEYKHFWLMNVFSKTPTKFNSVVYGMAQQESFELFNFFKANEQYNVVEGAFVADGEPFYVIKEGVK